MTHLPDSPRRRRNPWTTLLAVLLGMLAGAASAIGVSASPSGGTSVSEQTNDIRSNGKPVSVRHESDDVSIGFGGDDTTAALLGDAQFACDSDRTTATSQQPFRLTTRFARIRDGLTRAPPIA